MPRIKICGIRRLEDALAAHAVGADAIGLNFAAESPRCIGGVDAASEFVRAANLPMRWAGVFVNATPDFILDASARCGLSIVQLHGDEPPDFADALRVRLPAGIEIWKAFRIAGAGDLAPVAGYPADAVLLDAKVGGARGGTGHAFDWSILRNLRRVQAWVLAGGLKPENVSDGVRAVRPDWVDTASGVEDAPGVKSTEKMTAFVAAARGTAAAFSESTEKKTE